MNHQPYENWILDECDLAPDDKRKLIDHLEICPKCAKLEKGWKSARHEVKALSAVDAPVGFSQRWQVELIEKRKRHAQQQTRILLISLVSSASAIAIALGVFLLPQTSWISVMVSFVTGIFHLVNAIAELWIMFTGILKAAPASFLISLGLILSFFISLISILWAVSFYRITMKGTSLSHEN
jgi:hypothetical protein